MSTFVIDPGHGGTQTAGTSTSLGVVGPGGLREKDVTLEVARRLVSRLGGNAVLTRSRDENLSLGRRIAIARQTGANVFVSIHANSGPSGARGAEVWVHERSGPESAALAESLAGQLRRVGGRADVRRGALAVLSPEHHARGAAACLVELDYLSDATVERRFGNPGTLDQIASVLAEGLRRGGARYGDAEPSGDGVTWRLAKTIPDQNDGVQLRFFWASAKDAIRAVFGEDAWDGAVSAGEKEIEQKLVELLEALDEAPIGEEMKLIILATAVGAILPLVPLGIAYKEAREKHASTWAKRGFATGIAWAADDRSAKEVSQHPGLWTPYGLPKPGESLGPEGVDFDPAIQGVARNCYRMGLIAGMISGRQMTTTQRFNLYTDLQARDSNPNDPYWQELELPPAQRSYEFYLHATSVLLAHHITL